MGFTIALLGLLLLASLDGLAGYWTSMGWAVSVLYHLID